MAHYRHWGWPSSPYSAKTRGWLRFKGVEFADEVPTLGQMLGRIRKTVGRVVLPVVITPTGELLQDSTVIIDTINRREPGPSAFPTTPRQRFVARLLELYADEWVSIIAMHTRWNLPNRDFIVADFGACAAPRMSGWVQRMVGRRLAKRMSAYLPKLGIGKTTTIAIEAWLEELLDTLEAHFNEHRFLLGDAPCIGDFALMGPLHAHVDRDPASAYFLERRPAVRAWLARVHAGERGTTWLRGDALPWTMPAILRRFFADQVPFLASTAQALAQWRAEHPEPKRVPRSMGRAPVQIGAATGERARSTYALWMLQRALAAFDTAPASADLSGWLAEAQGEAFALLPREPELAFEDYQVVFT